MLVFAESGLTFLAVPKTGTTAIELALRPQADVIFAQTRKHVTAQRFKSKIAPFLKSTFGIETETVAVMRDPVDQIASWYRYRSRPALAAHPRSTAEMSFDAFVRAVISQTPPEFAQIGSQHAFLTDPSGAVVVDHLFAYDALPDFAGFMADRLDVPVTLERKNVSPALETPLHADVRHALLSARSEEFALYERLKSAGHLRFA